MICTTYFLTFFSELIPPTGKYQIGVGVMESNLICRQLLAVCSLIFVPINERKGGRLPIFLSFRISFTEIFYTFALVKKENIEENKKEDEK
jgi:hypothetical protein